MNPLAHIIIIASLTVLNLAGVGLILKEVKEAVKYWRYRK